MGLASVIGDECSGLASGEGVEEDADCECEQSLCDPLCQSGGCSGEVLFESHLAFEVGVELELPRFRCHLGVRRRLLSVAPVSS